MTFQAMPVKRLRQQVEVQIREAIASRRLVEGDRLPSEAELAEMFSVSRSTVREALRSLDTAGLIHKVPGASGGSFVRTMDYASFGDQIADSMGMLLDLGNADLEELVAARGMLEVPASRLAAENRDEDELARLVDVLDRQRAAKVSDPIVPDLDIEFHSSIAKSSGNRVLAALVYGLHRSTRPVAHMRLTEEQGQATVKQHIALYKAIEAKDAEGAEKAIRLHLEYLHSISYHTKPLR
jgi:GntR family transcriptional regulator, transcriptional repressor for pyruvate dehydrogenase complex